MNTSLPKLCSKAIFLSAMFAPVFVPMIANADSIVGQFSLAGDDTFNPTSITFTNPAYVLSSTLPGLTGLLSAPPNLQAVYMTSFAYAKAPGTLLFSTTGNGVTVTFTIGSATTAYIPASKTESASLKIEGYGTITDTGYDDTPGAFSLTSSTTGATGFQLVGDSPAAVTAEPSSLLLLGTALLGLAGMMMRRARFRPSSLALTS